MLQLAVYGKKDFGSAYLAAALAYALNSVSTTRYAPAVTTDSFAASFWAHDFAAQVEIGKHYGWFTPYAALRVQAFYTPAYRETSSPVAGSPFALAYDDSTTYSARTELGIRLAKSIAIHNGKTLGLHGRVAWAHDFSSAPSRGRQLPVASRRALHRHRRRAGTQFRSGLRWRRYHIHERVRDRRLIRWCVFGRVAELRRQGTRALHMVTRPRSERRRRTLAVKPAPWPAGQSRQS